MTSPRVKAPNLAGLCREVLPLGVEVAALAARVLCGDPLGDFGFGLHRIVLGLPHDLSRIHSTHLVVLVRQGVVQAKAVPPVPYFSSRRTPWGSSVCS